LIPILLLLLIDRIAVHDRRIFSGCHLFFPPRVVFSCVVVLMAFSLLGSFSAQAEEAAVLETIVVQSEQEEQPLKDEQAGIPGATTIIDGEKQYQRAVNNLADTFRYAPSMWAQSFSGGDSVFFSSRGSNLDATNYDGNGVKMLQDGMPVTTADGNNHNRFIDPLLAKNIVIAPGANALTYGASTLGGAVDFISPTALDVAPTELFMSAGSDGQRTARATAGVVLDQFDALITVGDKDWDGYRHHSETD
jgi:iron complex outermembrane receptor protein